MHYDPQRRKGLPLGGVRVADFTWVHAGPRCTQLLGFMGAEVIKIESGRLAERAQELGRPAGGARGGMFPLINGSKLGVTLNLTKPEAQELARRIFMVSDVVIENYAAGVMERMGLGYESLAKLKPDLILVSASGLGRTGPDKDYVAYGGTVMAFGGLTGLTGYEDGPPGWGTSATLADPMSGHLLAFSILTALYHRERTGEGQYIDVSMSEGAIGRIPEAIMDFTMNGRVRGPQGNFDDAMAPHGCYPTSAEDTWIALAVQTEQQWAALCDLMGRPQLAKDERFANLSQRQRHREELDGIIGAWTGTQERTGLFHRLQQAGIPSGPSYPTDGVVNDPHVQARGLIFDQRRADGQERMGKASRIPWLLSPRPAVDYYPPPALGEDNQYLFCDVLGLPQEEVQRLADEKVIF